MREDPRYEFAPLERRGVILGLDAAQLLGLVATAATALMVHAGVPGPAGTGAAAVVAAGGAAGSVWTRAGRPIGAHALAGASWRLAGGRRPRLDGGPTEGMVGGGAAARGMVGGGSRPGRRPDAHRHRAVRVGPLAPAGVGLFEDPGRGGDGPLGVVRDRRRDTWAAAVPVGGCSFGLLDPAEQAERLEGWRRVLGTLARPGSPVVAVQWLHRSWTSAAPLAAAGPNVPAGTAPDRAATAAAAAAGSHRQLEEEAAAAAIHRHAWLVVVVRSHRPSGAGARGGGRADRDGRASAALRRELRLLDGQLRAAELEPLAPLDLDQLAALVAGAAPRPPSGGRLAAAPAGGVGPVAEVDGWAEYRADGSWHATYWIAEWPRVAVGPDFISPLLLGCARAAVSVVMAPVPTDRAVRQARSARTADAADAELRARAGFLPSARRQRESEGVARREAELADGHHEFRFSGYVTVSADDPDQLHSACAAVEYGAQSAHLELRRLYGRQREAYTWTLPLGRGLRQGR